MAVITTPSSGTARPGSKTSSSCGTLSVNLVSVGIFSWVMVEPREREYDFTFLDEILELLGAADIDVDLGTPTAAPRPGSGRNTRMPTP